MICDRRVSSAEVGEAHLAQIDRHNPQLNAICTLDQDRALRKLSNVPGVMVKGSVQLSMFDKRPTLRYAPFRMVIDTDWKASQKIHLRKTSIFSIILEHVYF